MYQFEAVNIENQTQNTIKDFLFASLQNTIKTILEQISTLGKLISK